MKHIKESVTNYDIGVFTIDESNDLYTKYLKKYDCNYNLRDKIHYYHGFEKSNYNNNYNNTCRFIIAYNNKDILGICNIANYDLNSHFAISYCSTNKDYFSIGVSKKLLEETFNYFSKEYPDETLYFSGYSVDGWKYLRKYLLELSNKYDVKIKEKGVEYPGNSTNMDEFYDLVGKSKKEIESIYGKYDY